MTEPVKRYYIMESAVVPMLDKQMTYTPLVNYKTGVHVVPLVMAADYARLEQECERLRDLLRSAQWRMQVDPSCQSGVIEKCGCRKCVHSRADAALSAKP